MKASAQEVPSFAPVAALVDVDHAVGDREPRLESAHVDGGRAVTVAVLDARVAEQVGVQGGRHCHVVAGVDGRRTDGEAKAVVDRAEHVVEAVPVDVLQDTWIAAVDEREAVDVAGPGPASLHVTVGDGEAPSRDDELLRGTGDRVAPEDRVRHADRRVVGAEAVA